jgi:hypothetical protein
VSDVHDGSDPTGGDERLDNFPTGGLAPFDALRRVFGLSVPQLATLLQVTVADLRDWVTQGVPIDVSRVVAEFEGLGRMLAGVAAHRPGESVIQLARTPLDDLRGRSILEALAYGERDRVGVVVARMSSDRQELPMSTPVAKTSAPPSPT